MWFGVQVYGHWQQHDGAHHRREAPGPEQGKIKD